MTTTSAVAVRPVAAAPRVAPAASTKATAAMAGDTYQAPKREGANLAQPIGMGLFAIGAFGSLMVRGNAFFALMGVAFAGLALAGSGVKIKKPDGSSDTAGFKGVTVLAPGAGLVVGVGAAMALGVTGLAAAAVVAAPCLLGILLAKTVFK